MDKEFIDMLIKIVIYLPFILFLIYIFLKYSGTKLQTMQNGRFIKVLERVNLSKDNSLMVVKIGNKTHVVTSSINKIEILRELEVDEELKLQEPKVVLKFPNLKDIYYKLKRKGRE